MENFFFFFFLSILDAWSSTASPNINDTTIRTTLPFSFASFYVPLPHRYDPIEVSYPTIKKRKYGT